MAHINFGGSEKNYIPLQINKNWIHCDFYLRITGNSFSSITTWKPEILIRNSCFSHTMMAFTEEEEDISIKNLSRSSVCTYSMYGIVYGTINQGYIYQATLIIRATSAVELVMFISRTQQLYDWSNKGMCNLVYITLQSPFRLQRTLRPWRKLHCHPKSIRG